MTIPGLCGGNDTCDRTGDALATLAERRGAWPGDDLTAITLLASLIDQAGRFLPDLVTSARLNGHSRDQIAHALATRRAGIAKAVTPRALRHAFITAALDDGVPLRDVQDAASHADPGTTMRYDRARGSLDRHATYIAAAYVAGAAR